MFSNTWTFETVFLHQEGKGEYPEWQQLIHTILSTYQHIAYVVQYYLYTNTLLMWMQVNI